MSEIGWLPRGMEQGALPISQPLPKRMEYLYRVGGNHTIQDASDASFHPHFWLFVLSTARWRMGYDYLQRPVYTIGLVQYEVFHVLLVDYWKPPREEQRKDQFKSFTKLLAGSQDALPFVVVGGSDSGGVAASGAADSGGYNSPGGPG